MPVISEGIENLNIKLLTEYNSTSFKEIIKNALFRSLRGKSRLEGSGDLKVLWPYLESEANKKGVIGVVSKGGKILMVPVSETITENTGIKRVNYFFTKNPYYQYAELKLKVPLVINGKPTDQTIEEIFYPEGAERDKLFAILENDVDLMPDLAGIDEDLEKLKTIMDAIFHDIIASKKKIYFIFPQEPDSEDWGRVGELWKNDVMGYVAMPKSSKPNAKEGKAGIDPNSINLQVFQPDNKGRDLWADYKELMRKVLWQYGIRFDTLENKTERAPVAEVAQSTSYFDDIENERRQCRENFINWVIRNWGGDYRLIYGKKISK